MFAKSQNFTCMLPIFEISQENKGSFYAAFFMLKDVQPLWLSDDNGLVTLVELISKQKKPQKSFPL